MTPEEAKASLGVATGLIDNVLLKPQEEEMTEEMPTEDVEQGMEMEQPEQDIRQEFDQFKQEISQTIKEEIGGLKTTIEQALSESEDEED